MQIRTLIMLVIISAVSLTAGAVDTPATIATKSASAWGGQEAFTKLGVIRLTVSESEELPDGTTNENAYTAYLDTSLVNSRIEWPRQVVTVRNGDTGWATIGGQPDQRKQTPRMVPAVNRKKLMPILLPFSLQMSGINFGENAVESNFGEIPAYRFPVQMGSLFFDTPLIGDTWQVFVARDDFRFLAAGFLPNPEYKDVQPEGMQYRVLATTVVNGVTLPSVIQVEGLTEGGMTTNHGRTATIKIEVLDEPNPALFIDPAKLATLEEDE